MTVSELIAALSALDGSLPVKLTVQGYPVDPGLPALEESWLASVGGTEADLADGEEPEPPLFVALAADSGQLNKAMGLAPEAFRAD